MVPAPQAVPCDGNLGLSLAEVAEARHEGSWRLIMVTYDSYD